VSLVEYIEDNGFDTFSNKLSGSTPDVFVKDKDTRVFLEMEVRTLLGLQNKYKKSLAIEKIAVSL